MRKMLKADEGSLWINAMAARLGFGRFRPFPHQACFNHPTVLFLYCLKLPVLSVAAQLGLLALGMAQLILMARLGTLSDLHKPSLRLDCPGRVGSPKKRRRGPVWQGIMPCYCPLFSSTASKG
eukprot:s305_g20.t1